MSITLPTAGHWARIFSAEALCQADSLTGWFYVLSAQGELLVNLWILILLGFGVGFLVGGFGLGSGFLMAPLLNLATHIPFNVAVGSDLTQMLGAATISHLRGRARGFVDYKLAGLLFLGSVVGVECGARLLEWFKYAGSLGSGAWRVTVLQAAMTGIYLILLGWIGSTLWRELRGRGRIAEVRAVPEEASGAGPGTRLRTLRLPPLVSLPVSGVDSVSLWLILGVGWVSGLLTGLLGISGAFVRMPAMIYVLGVPTVVSLGTNLLELFGLSLYGALTHSLKGNVDLVLVVILLLSTTFGNQVGFLLQKKVVRPWTLKLYTSLFFLTGILLLLKLFW